MKRTGALILTLKLNAKHRKLLEGDVIQLLDNIPNHIKHITLTSQKKKKRKTEI
jgi:hydroxypyruvate isomerase